MQRQSFDNAAVNVYQEHLSSGYETTLLTHFDITIYNLYFDVKKYKLNKYRL